MTSAHMIIIIINIIMLPNILQGLKH